MKIKLSPKQNLVLWQLLITGDEPAQSKVKPPLTPKERKALVDSGLIELEQRGRVKHIVLTDKAWAWASEQKLDALSKSNDATLLVRLINKVQDYLQTNNVSFAEFLTPPVPAGEAKESPAEEAGTLGALTNSLNEQIQAAYYNVTKGQWNVRVRLSDLRKQLVHTSKDAIDAALRQMQLDGHSVLMPLDDPQEIEAEDEEAAVNIAGDRRHIVYMKG